MMLSCLVMRVLCHVDVLWESTFRLFKPHASYELFIEPSAQVGVDYSSASRQLPRARVTMYGHVAKYGRGSLPDERSTSVPWRSS
jgi:hypothetical protein